MSKIKTYEGWSGNFTNYVRKGDEIYKSMYDHFLDILPPFRLNSGQGVSAGFQVSEPDSDGIDDNGNMRILYSTFGMINGRYFYLGLNFKGETNSRYEPVNYAML